ncbi:MAG TPA: NAD(P)-dependent oxidoreductase, partial [Pirellulales bacterium]|nr:NAD(P)-dependent oxidoreductase [Pirellulales bacterium]
DFKFDRYVYLSTVDVYPDCSPVAATSENTPLDPAAQSAYGFHKHLAEQCVRHAARQWLILRLGGFVGPGMWKNPIHDILQGGPLWLDPASQLQFLHTDDAAELALRLVDAGGEREIFNFCGKAAVSLAEVIETAGGDVSVKPGSPRVHYEVDISKLSARAEVPETRATVLDFVRAGRAIKEAA